MRMRYVCEMRRSNFKHPLAVLRQIIGYGQKEMAELAECSAATIQSIELGRLKLSEKLGVLISGKTGIKLSWLLEGDPDKPPIGDYFDEQGVNKPYTKELFENRMAGKLCKDGASAADEFKTTAAWESYKLEREVKAIVFAATLQGKYPLALYKLNSVLANVSDYFRVTQEMRDAVDRAELQAIKPTKGVKKQLKP